MSKKFPTVNYKQIASVAKKLDFYFYRQGKGSHEVWRRDKDKRQTTIPKHGSKPLKRKTLKSILEDFEITISEFKDFL